MRSIEVINDEIKLLRKTIREELQFNEYGDLEELYNELDKLTEELRNAKTTI